MCNIDNKLMKELVDDHMDGKEFIGHHYQRTRLTGHDKDIQQIWHVLDALCKVNNIDVRDVIQKGMMDKMHGVITRIE